jgi:menaquinone-9 beta-reductase
MREHSPYDVIIAGGGPAGSSAAIHLAARGVRVLLAEQKKFPRPKLCGEFISPECTSHFERLGLAEQMRGASPSSLTETVFYSRNGANVRVPSHWFGNGGIALGLSRAEMDERLLRRAAEAGVTVLEDAHVIKLLFDNDRVVGATLKRGGKEETYQSHFTIDATGRSRTLARMVERACSTSARLQRAPLVAFKAHLRNIQVAPGACEIYFYPGGYGGLNNIEAGLSNLCFIVNARDVRARNSDPERVMREVVFQNQRAAYTLGPAQVQSEWLAVSLERFGRRSVSPAKGLLAIGDAASFIDPFTGSGMLMALESGDLAARVVSEGLRQARDVSWEIAATYESSYNRQFNSRLRLCSMMRRAAFVPGLADVAIRVFGASETLRRRVTRATRSSSERNLSSAHSFK